MRPNFHAALVEKPSYRKKPQYEIRKYIQKDLRKRIKQTIAELKNSYARLLEEKTEKYDPSDYVFKMRLLDINSLFRDMSHLDGDALYENDDYILG